MNKLQIKAKEEISERKHFNDIYRNAETVPVYCQDLKNHPDHRIIKAGISQLGGDQNKKCLLLGCGAAAEAWYLSRFNRHTVAIDIADIPLRIAARGAKKYGFTKDVSFSAMSGYSMGFKDKSFDCIYGHAILHHLDIKKIGPEINRILKKGGTVVFTEPFDENMILRFIRNYIPYPGKHRVSGEKALRMTDIRAFSNYFDEFEYCGTELLSMVGRIVSHTEFRGSKFSNAVIDLLYLIDRFTFRLIPVTRFLSRAVVCCFYKH